MKHRIFLVGESVELRLLNEELNEKGVQTIFVKKEEFFSQRFDAKHIDLLIYELSEEETKETSILDQLFKLGFKNVIFLAEDAELDTAIEFVKKGAQDFKLLSTPLDILEKAVFYAIHEVQAGHKEDEFITNNPKMLKILRKLEGIAQTNVPILLVGESGTGKELLSRFIHKKSPRRQGPFVAINCAALPETLLESELFGYEKGAFSGATFRKKGKIELADGGTLLLDEITEMHPQLQSKLLRVLQEGEVDKLGGYHPVKVDIRLISTTNRNIEKEVEEGRFRADLYYRINVITVKIPPLRERKEDIMLLANYFLEKFSHLYQKEIKGFSKEAQDFLMNYDFPGNVRELKNMIERAVLTTEGEFITTKDLLDPFGQDEELTSKVVISGTELASFTTGGVKTLEELEREAIMKALEVSKGNKTKAAELLGITVRTLRNKLKQYKEQGLI
ncbi:MAG: sigma-54-dependent Fis family transcriptional regulator [Thermodesulfobacteria bacterium]|nr:sigma-54-dependent Fis family transcriptional regulator [Thermodesulfobacteriota bacterium]